MHHHDFTVSVVEFSDRKFFMLQWVCPLTGKKKTQSSKVPRADTKAARTAAERAAAKLEDELRGGRYKPASKITWQEFRDRYENEVLEALADGTFEKVSGVFNSIETRLAPKRLRDVTASRLSFYAAELRGADYAEATIKAHLAHLGAALHWAVKVGMLAAAPQIDMPKRAKASKLMKGRPITLEEFERMLAKVGSIVGETVAFSWQFYLRGLWLSGLRLAESLELWWDRRDKLCVDFTGKRPMLWIPAELEKGNQDRLLPMAPEFAEFLQAIPEAERTGRVFKLAKQRKRGGEMFGSRHVSKKLCEIGEAAGVVVDRDGDAVKYASAHDLRRSFGERWAMRVMPQVLMELMRHEDISTTMKFYVGRNAERTADVLWQAHELKPASNILSNTSQPSHEKPPSDSAPSAEIRKG